MSVIRGSITALVLSIAVALVPGTALTGDLPTLVFEAPPALSAAAARLQEINPNRVRAVLELVGLEKPGPPISIRLAEEDSDLAQRTPSWVSGYTGIPSGHVVLFPTRQLSYPHHSLEELLIHELTHVFVTRATDGAHVPRWFEEGVAMVASGERALEDRAYGFWMGLTAAPMPLRELDQLFGQDAAAVRKAYLLAEALVRHLQTAFGSSTPKRIFEHQGRGLSFEDALWRTTGKRLEEFEREFWARQTAGRRWIPIVTSSAMVWVAIIVLALWVFRRQRRRAAAVRRQWEEEER